MCYANSMIPQTNGNLLSVTRGGYTEDYDRPAGTADPVWSGNLEIYVKQRILSSLGAQQGELNRVEEVTLFIPGDLPVTLQGGDTVVYQAGNPDNPITFTGNVRDSIDPAFMAMLPDYYKVALEDVNAP